ncbi:hypothetical protein [Mesobacillus harenae]|uniref:hypothetical protein n=1 Tax=Mesobacillus harenae TaxID=2213203 RepID=UPI0015801858|nr:hypothetical protein [Mesobacillus harenae]
MPEKIGEIIFNLIIPAIFTFIITWTIAYFFANNSLVTVGESIEIKENQYLTPININALNNINKLSITIPNEQLTENQVNSSAPINILRIENNIGVENGSVFEIAKVNSDSTVGLMVETTTMLNSKDIIINKNGNAVDVRYSSDVVSPLEDQKRQLIINAILYAVIVFALNSWADKRRDKKILAAKEERDAAFKGYEESKADLRSSYEVANKVNEKLLEEKNLEIQNARKEIDKFEKELNNFKTDIRKHNILLLARLNDYRKELNFWRNTIRKVIYELPKGEEKAEQFMKTIASSLKTYQTHEKEEYNFETLKILSTMIKDTEKEAEKDSSPGAQ